MVINCVFIGFGKSIVCYYLLYVFNCKDSWYVVYIFCCYVKLEEQVFIYFYIYFISDFDEVLNDFDVKLVVVCIYVDSYFEYVKCVLEVGKNVLVEKLFILMFVQVKELFVLVKSKGLIVMLYQNCCFDFCFLIVKKVIESGKLGEIVEVESYFDYYCLVVEIKSGLLQDGVFYGFGVYMMDQIIFLFGCLDYVVYDICSLCNKVNFDDIFEV